MIRMLASRLVASESALSLREVVNAKFEAERIEHLAAVWLRGWASAAAAAGTGTAAVTVARTGIATRITRRIAVQVRRAVASLTNKNIYKCIRCNQ